MNGVSKTEVKTLKTDMQFARSLVTITIVTTSWSLYSAESDQLIEPLKQINLSQVELGKDYSDKDNVQILASPKTLTGDPAPFLPSFMDVALQQIPFVWSSRMNQPERIK